MKKQNINFNKTVFINVFYINNINLYIQEKNKNSKLNFAKNIINIFILLKVATFNDTYIFKYN